MYLKSLVEIVKFLEKYTSSKLIQHRLLKKLINSYNFFDKDNIKWFYQKVLPSIQEMK